MRLATCSGISRTGARVLDLHAHKLLMAHVPPIRATRSVAAFGDLRAMTLRPAEQRAEAASFKGVEQTTKASAIAIWTATASPTWSAAEHSFRDLGGGRLEANAIDTSYAFSRATAGTSSTGGDPAADRVRHRDGKGPLMFSNLVEQGLDRLAEYDLNTPATCDRRLRPRWQPRTSTFHCRTALNCAQPGRAPSC